MKVLQTLMSAMIALTIPLVAQQVTDQKPQKVRVSWGVMGGNLESKVEPKLPVDEQGRPLGGDVVLRINIDTQGNVRQAIRLEGRAELADAAIQAVQQWKFMPFLLNGNPVEVETTVKLTLEPGHEVKTASPLVKLRFICPRSRSD
jgi:protein TonB